MIERIKTLSIPYPVKVFFNFIRHNDFIRALNNFSNGQGFYPENMACAFPFDLVEDEGGNIQDYDYIEFWNYSGNKEARLSFSEFIEVLKEAAQAEIKCHPDSESDINRLIARTEKFLNEIS